MALFGLLNVNKPAGVTSRWVVDQVKRHVKPTPVGHAGTLDPLATGVLMVCVGHATRLVEYLHELPKRYRATFLLGCTSNTEDVDGDVTEIPHAPQPSRDALAVAGQSLVGCIGQRPPAYSAIKVAGRRAYQRARAGETLELAQRPVQVHSLTIVDYAYPRLTLDIECSSGTYVRSLGRDLAEHVGTGAVMSALVRTAIGPFTVDDSLDADKLALDAIVERLLPPLRAVEQAMDVHVVADDEIGRLSNGLEIELHGAGPRAAVDSNGRLIAILARRQDGQFGPAKFFPLDR